MSATEQKPYTYQDLRRDLTHLQSLACDLGVADEKLRLFAKQMRSIECGFPLYDAIKRAADGAVADALEKRFGKETSNIDPMVIAQECQDALDVIDLAVARDHLEDDDRGGRDA